MRLEVSCARCARVSQLEGRCLARGLSSVWDSQRIEYEKFEALPINRKLMMLRHLRSLVVAYDHLNDFNRKDLTTALEIIKNREVLNKVSFALELSPDVLHSTAHHRTRRRMRSRQRCSQTSTAASLLYFTSVAR